MFKGVLIALTSLCLACAILLFVSGLTAPGVGVLIFWTAVVLGGLVFERYRYKRPLDIPPGSGWTATGEKFVDTASGRAITVYFEPSSGKRVYVDDGPAPTPPT